MALGYVNEIYDKRTEESTYVGSTTGNPMHRWAGHLMDVFRRFTKVMLPIHKYLQAQGLDLIHFGFRVREEVFWEVITDLRKREQVWMDNLKPKCNVNPAYVTEEQRKKVRAARARRWWSKKVLCECGLTMAQGCLSTHLKTARHARLLKAKHS